MDTASEQHLPLRVSSRVLVCWHGYFLKKGIIHPATVRAELLDSVSGDLRAADLPHAKAGETQSMHTSISTLTKARQTNARINTDHNITATKGSQRLARDIVCNKTLHRVPYTIYTGQFHLDLYLFIYFQYLVACY